MRQLGQQDPYWDHGQSRFSADGGGGTAGMVASAVGGGLKLLGEPLELLLLHHHLHLGGFILLVVECRPSTGR